jgi:hypothetical protein
MARKKLPPEVLEYFRKQGRERQAKLAARSRRKAFASDYDARGTHGPREERLRMPAAVATQAAPQQAQIVMKSRNHRSVSRSEMLA